MSEKGGINTILFDLDGTLVDSRTDLANSVNHALKSLGHPEKSRSEIVGHIGNGMRVLLSGVLGPVSEDILESGIRFFSAHYERHLTDFTRMYEGVEESLAFLSGRAKLGVVTNKPVRFSEKILDVLGIRSHFKVVLGGDSMVMRKPDPAPVIKALDMMHAIPGLAMMVGDGMQDMMAGQSAGTKTCLALYGFGTEGETSRIKPTYTIQRFDELKEMV